jgi:uncharacterized protein YlxW (UPF0749 family)
MAIVGSVWGSMQFIPKYYKRPVTETVGILWSKYKKYQNLKDQVKNLREKVKRLQREKQQMNQKEKDSKAIENSGN